MKFYGDAGVKVWNNVNVRSGQEDSNLQLIHGGWWSSEKLEINKIVITTVSGVPGLLSIWDQDLSATESQANIRGSSNTPLLTIAFGDAATSGDQANMTIITEEQMPRIEFDAGICFQVTGTTDGNGVDITVEGRRY